MPAIASMTNAVNAATFAEWRRCGGLTASLPLEIARTIVFLAGDQARYLTAQVVAVEGGYLAQ